MRTAIYIRVSTDEQAKEGYSIPAQHERLLAFCKSQSWEIVAEYIEEGVSAKDTDRPQLNKLLASLDGIDIVLVYKLDRLTRSVLDLYSLLKKFDEQGVAFKSATEVYDTSTAMGRLFITLVAALAQWERENLGERVIMGMEQLVLSGYRAGGKAPYGYSNKNKELTINELEAEKIKYIYKMYLEGKGVRTICNQLNRQGVITNTGSKWTGKPLVYILSNPVYKGVIRWGDTLVEGKHEPIIDSITWNRVQAELNKRKEIAPRFATGIFPFSGVLSCGYCKSNMQIKKNGKYKFYICSTKQCKQIHIRIDRLEELVLNQIEMTKEQSWRVTDKKDTYELDKVRKQLQDMERKKKRWHDAYDNEAITLKEFKNKTSELKEQQLSLEQQETELQKLVKTPTDTNIEALLNFSSLWHIATPDEQKRLVNGLVDHVYLYLLPEFDIERNGNGIKNQKNKIKHFIDIKPIV